MKNQRKGSASRNSKSVTRENTGRYTFGAPIGARPSEMHAAKSSYDLYDDQAYPNPNRCIE